MSLKPSAPQDIVVVGASGDLSRRKLLPALYNLAASDLLPRQGSIIGLARSDLDDERFRKFARGSIEEFSRTGESRAGLRVFGRQLRTARSGRAYRATNVAPPLRKEGGRRSRHE
ncbi:MAG: hypothetical protein IIA91_06070 [Chloroflexi bacterium]|nr:hypothetical protein [Chloroflexota bacterium]